MAAPEYTFIDYNNEQVHLTAVVHQIIILKHPEVAKFFERITETLREPDTVRKSVTDSRTRLYYRSYKDVLGGKFITVVVKRADRNFISTVYATDRIKEGEVIWQR